MNKFVLFLFLNISFNCFTMPNRRDGSYSRNSSAELNNRLIRAVEDQDLEAIDSLINLGADVNLIVTNENLRDPLLIHAIRRNSNLDIIRLLYRRVNDPFQVDNMGNTPLHVALENRRYDVARELITNRARRHYPGSSLVNMTNYFEQTPLHIAARQGISEIIQFLIENNANINAQDYNLDTPIHMAIRNENFNAVIGLLSENAALDLANIDDLTPVELAQHRVNLITGGEEGNLITASNILSFLNSHNVLRSANIINPFYGEQRGYTNIANPFYEVQRSLNLSQARQNQDLINNIGDFEALVVENSTLVNSQPQELIDNLRTRFTEALDLNPSGIFRQEIINWIHLEIDRLNRLASPIQNIDSSFGELRTENKPFFVQQTTLDNIDEGIRLSDGSRVEGKERNLINSLIFWRSRNMSDEDYNKLLAQGDIIYNPTEGTGDPVTVDTGTARRFIAMQILNSDQLIQQLPQEYQGLLNAETIQGDQLVKIIDILKTLKNS